MKILLVLFGLLFCFCVNGQVKAVSGFYVNSNGDTITGKFPKYNQWVRNPDKVEFMPAGNSVSLQLTPANCKAFYISNYDEYLSFSGARLLNPIDDDVAISNANFFPDTRDSVSFVTVFLRLVTKTPLCDIYILNDQVRTNLYYKIPGQSIQELKFKKYFSEGIMHDFTEYRTQLRELFMEEILNKNLSKKLEELSYNEEQIQKFIEHVAGATKTYKKNQRLQWTVLAGASVNFLDASGDKSIPEVNSKFSNSLTPFISFGYILPINRNFNRFFIYPQLTAHSFKNSTTYSSTYTKRVITYHSPLCISPEVNVGMNLINNPDCRLFLYGGAGIVFLIKNTQTGKRISLADGSASSYDIPMSKMSYTANLSAGTCVKDRFVVTASYYGPVPVANFDFYSAMHSSLRIGFGYNLK